MTSPLPAGIPPRVSVATGIVFALGAYLALGALFAPAFALWGCGRLDPAAATGSAGFRILILPGAAALWPLLLKRWLCGARSPPAERNAHRDAAPPPDAVTAPPARGPGAAQLAPIAPIAPSPEPARDAERRA